MPVVINPSPEISTWKQIENDFFNSLKNLSALYGFELLNVKGKIFPYNIALSFASAETCMKNLKPDLSLVIIQDAFHAATIATVKTFNTKTTLYFINVNPLYDLLQDKKRKNAAILLQSVFTYLHKVVGISYYTDTHTCLYYCYENISNWLIDECGELSKKQYKKDVENPNVCFHAGRAVQKKIRNTNQLNLLNSRNKIFKPACDWENELLKISTRVHIMIEEFGETSVNDMIFERLLEPDEEDRIYLEHYMAFVYDDDNWIYESIIEQVNNEIQEMSAIDEPSSIQFFDKEQQAENHNLSFPIRLFDLINDLCDLLNRYKQ